MRRLSSFVAVLIIAGLFAACPNQEAPAPASLHIQIQGHVYDNQTKQPVPDNYVGMFRESRTESGMYGWMKVVETRTDSVGLYSLQCDLGVDPCKGAKLFLMPISSDNGTGVSIGCTDTLQTIDLYK